MMSPNNTSKKRNTAQSKDHWTSRPGWRPTQSHSFVPSSRKVSHERMKSQNLFQTQERRDRELESIRILYYSSKTKINLFEDVIGLRLYRKMARELLCLENVDISEIPDGQLLSFSKSRSLLSLFNVGNLKCTVVYW